MPRKRPIEIRMAEMEDKLDGLKLEKSIQEMRIRMNKKRPRRRKKVSR